MDQSAEKTVFQLEKLYQTQPPQQVRDVKISQIFEYLIFSGTPIHLSCHDSKLSDKMSGSAYLVDIKADHIILDVPSLNIALNAGLELACRFGYKRKRAEFNANVISLDSTLLKMSMPSDLFLTNLRRNPRVQVDKGLWSSGIQTNMIAATSIGTTSFSDIEVFEVSQLGMSLFVKREDGLLMPGDKIEELRVSSDGSDVFKVKGVVSRVDTGRSSPTLKDSYQLVVLFRHNPPKELDEKVALEKVERKRGSKRIPVMDSKPCFFSAEHPFFRGRRVEGQVYEISSSGLSCILEKTNFPIIPGMRFYNCNLQLPFSPSRDIVFEVVHVDFLSDGKMNQFKLGGEFVKSPVELIKDISSYADKQGGGFIKDVSEEDLDQLWEFMFETNFIYQKKREQIQKQSKQILETYHRLVSSDNPIVKKIVFTEDAEIKGHISGIRYYDHAWIIQHLNAKSTSSGSAAKGVLKSISEFFYDTTAHKKNDIYYIVSFYRPNNPYPAILFGECTRRMNDSEMATTIDFSFGMFDANSPRKNVENAELSIDTTKAVRGLVDHLLKRNYHNFIRAFGLSDSNPLELQIRKEYEKLDLFRDRHILSLERNGSVVYALVDSSSPGLNLSEITNGVFLFSDCMDEASANDLSQGLLNLVYEKYFERRDLAPAVLSPFGETHARNVSWGKVYTCWILSEKGFQPFQTVTNEIFDDFRSLIAKFKSTLEVKKFGDSTK